MLLCTGRSCLHCAKWYSFAPHHFRQNLPVALRHATVLRACAPLTASPSTHTIRNSPTFNLHLALPPANIKRHVSYHSIPSLSEHIQPTARPSIRTTYLQSSSPNVPHIVRSLFPCNGVTDASIFNSHLPISPSRCCRGGLKRKKLRHLENNFFFNSISTPFLSQRPL